MKSKILAITLVALFFISSCGDKKDDLSLPTVSTKSIRSIAFNSAVAGGQVSSDGGKAVSKKGVCWNTQHSPTIANMKTDNGSGIGDYDSGIGNLNPNTTYYVRAYATNEDGTQYGTEVSFKTLAK